MKKYGFVYLWFDKKRKMYYVGCHWGTANDGYICSSNRMRDAYRRRPNDFKRRILKSNILDKVQMFEEEYKFLFLIKNEELGKKYYNLRKHKWGHWTTDLNSSLTIKEKISKKTKEAMQRPDIKEKYLAGLEQRDNKSSDLEVREKRRQSMKKTMAEKFPIEDRYNPVKFGSKEYKNNMANKTKQKWENRTKEDKQKISEKISNSLTASKQKRSDIMKSKFWWNNGVINKRNDISPGDDWVRGKLK